jgi:hypothetical protein
METFFPRSSWMTVSKGVVAIKHKLPDPVGRPQGLGLEFLAHPTKIDLLLSAKCQSPSIARKCHHFKTERLLIEAAGPIKIGNGQYQVVHPIDAHVPPPYTLV